MCSIYMYSIYICQLLVGNVNEEKNNSCAKQAAP
jgi:hypothetical protein